MIIYYKYEYRNNKIILWGNNMKLKLIHDWQNKNLKCYFCGQTRSVKYTTKIQTLSENIKTREVCVCNKCALQDLIDKEFIKE